MRQDLLRDIFKNLAGRQHGLDFSSWALCRAQFQGLYFGPTLEKFSYLWKPPGR